MSEAAEQKTISLAQIDGRIAEIEAQRNAALSRAARIAGERDEALDLVRILKAEVDRLTDRLAVVGEIEGRVAHLEEHGVPTADGPASTH